MHEDGNLTKNMFIFFVASFFASVALAANSHHGSHQHNKATGPPHIVFVVADDLGWNDVGWHNPDVISPNLDRYARQGIILNQSYVMPVCSPSRSAFMTGFYPYHMGLQNGVIKPTMAQAVPENITMLPKLLKTAGYKTHAVGKWHLGFCNWKYTPTYRGFDTFFGYWLGAEDYYTHTRENGFDFRFNTDVYHGGDHVYSANLFAKRAIEIIETHNASQPLYLYLPFQSVHGPLQVPQKFQDMYSQVKIHQRQTLLGMVSAMDEAFGNITKALEHSGIADNMLLVFTTDNGGPATHGANNWPLRGSKGSVWEGGTRGAAFAYSKNLFNRTGYTSDGLIHAVDWFPTFLDFAGVKPDASIDGVSARDTLTKGAASSRTEMVYNIAELTNHSAIRSGNFKLVKGGATGQLNGWYSPDVDNSHHAHSNFTAPEYMLFNLKYDPTEHHDVSHKYPAMLETLKAKLATYTQSLVPQQDRTKHPQANPKNFGGVWSPGWC